MITGQIALHRHVVSEIVGIVAEIAVGDVITVVDEVGPDLRMDAGIAIEVQVPAGTRTMIYLCLDVPLETSQMCK